MKAWLKVIKLGLFGKVAIKIAAPFVVPFLSPEERMDHHWFGVRDATDVGYWNIAFRNAGHNMFTRPMPKYTTTGNTDDQTLEKLDGFQWRYRVSLSGQYVSFRMTWGAPSNKGKKEFYIGWVMNETSYMRLSFFQFRPGIFGWIFIAWLIYTLTVIF